jgi:hypothetical protein
MAKLALAGRVAIVGLALILIAGLADVAVKATADGAKLATAGQWEQDPAFDRVRADFARLVPAGSVVYIEVDRAELWWNYLVEIVVLSESRLAVSVGEADVVAGLELADPAAPVLEIRSAR